VQGITGEEKIWQHLMLCDRGLLDWLVGWLVGSLLYDPFSVSKTI
jgi:hypothetical protein